MVRAWDEGWELHPTLKVRSGAQAKSFVVRSRHDPDVLGFMKVVSSTYRKARLRFAREVLIYETLPDVGLPTLMDHNVAEARYAKGELYLVLEYIPGGTLVDHVEKAGPVAFNVALPCIRRIATIIGALHAEGVTHRDLKPANIVIRNQDFADPVVVDFGLSFVDDGTEDLTATNETVGNRFLALPEHAFGSRDAVSDVTQLAGVLFYLLTGLQPRGLDDGNGNKPHQTSAGRERLNGLMEPEQRRRLLSVFDRAFARVAIDRFESTEVLMNALEGVMAPMPERRDYESMREQMKEKWLAADGPRHEKTTEVLNDAWRILSDTMRRVAEQNPVQATQSAKRQSAIESPPFVESKYAMSEDGNPKQFRLYRFELRGPGDIVLVVDGEERWRGTALDDLKLFEAIAIASLEPLLS